MIAGMVASSKRPDTREISARIAGMLRERGIETVDNWQESGTVPDILVVLGGDGTILRTARRVAALNIPMLTVNLGRIGFMAELEIDEVGEYLDALENQDYRLEKRMMLEVAVRRQGTPVFQSEALNEALIIRYGHMTKLKVYFDDSYFADYVADGLICATPTGSTAHSLAAGGPVILPDMEAILLTPVCPNMLALKPLVVDAAKVITIMPEVAEQTSLIVDGQDTEPLLSGDEIEIRKSQRTVSFIRFKQHPFYEHLGKKLTRV